MKAKRSGVCVRIPAPGRQCRAGLGRADWAGRCRGTARLRPLPSGPGFVRDGFVALLDPASGRFRRLPGLSTQAKHTPALGWSPDGEWLLMAVQPDDGHDRLVMWRRGQRGLTVLPTVLPAWTLGSWQGLVVRH